MSSQDDNPEGRVVAVVLIAAVLLAVGLAVGVGIQKVRAHGAKGSVTAVAGAAGAGDAATGAAAAPAAAVEVATPAAPAAGDDASVVVENGVVKFYFAPSKFELAPGALGALADAIAAAKGGKRLVLSGFHDATGDPARNAEIARKRAFAVRDALIGAGVIESSLELKKPEQTTGTGNNAEARRVEVMIVP
ncbi:MAG: OmpA family protein [Hydrogenophaga sp.]|uniref:OmpA family protein n=1 Tax=Hydrogenophaga sp. TaxID=1904254 RepID=UPI0025C6A8BF|nr:OmpA family protein [Hydrogenophaga sp.]MBT9554087.1 OmpA family protein [Hydrogenophaga sp.]